MDTSHPLQENQASVQQSSETFHQSLPLPGDEVSPWDNVPSENSSRTSTTPSLNWAVRRVRTDGTSSSFRDDPPPTNRANEIDNSESSAPDTRNAANAPDTTGPPPGTTRHHRNKEISGQGEDYHSSTNKTDMQLTLSFSLILKLVDELMLQLAQHKDWSAMEQAGLNDLLKLDANVIRVFKVRKVTFRSLDFRTC